MVHTIFCMPVPTERDKHKRSLLREQAYYSIRDAIVDGTLAPGEKLRDPELERWLGISRTPIREALARLEMVGLVRAEPGRSTVVSAIGRKAVLDAQAVVAAMHALAMRTAVPLLTPDEIAAMEAANAAFALALQNQDAAAAVRCDDDFHAVAVTASRNDAVAVVLEQYSPTLRRLERLRFSSLSARDSIAQHQRIIQCCRAGDPDAAAREVERNWQTLTLLVDQLDHV